MTAILNKRYLDLIGSQISKHGTVVLYHSQKDVTYDPVDGSVSSSEVSIETPALKSVIREVAPSGVVTSSTLFYIPAQSFEDRGLFTFGVFGSEEFDLAFRFQRYGKASSEVYEQTLIIDPKINHTIRHAGIVYMITKLDLVFVGNKVVMFKFWGVDN